MFRRRYPRVIAAVVLAWAVAAIALFVVHHGDAPIRADAVFVLSGSGTRLPVGIRLVREGYAPLLVVSQSSPGPSKLEREACAHRIQVRVLCVRADPYSTVGEAELLRRLAAARGWHTIDAVTSQYHVIRARIILRRCFHGRLRVVGAPNVWWDLPLNAALETVKIPYHELVHRQC
jgi:uncharacterized SAM-binding protein YcdF (DUF218 family)